MNKKYTILRTKGPVKAQGGVPMNIGPYTVSRPMQDPYGNILKTSTFNTNLNGIGFNSTDLNLGDLNGNPVNFNSIASNASNALAGSGVKDAFKNFGEGLKNMDKGVAVGALAPVAKVGTDALFDKAIEKNSNTDAYGNEVFDEKDASLMKRKAVASGVLDGASMGASIGGIIPGGALIGAGIGALAGGISGAFKGKKAAEEEEALYKASLIRNANINARQQDLAALQALSAKSGRKLGNFKLIKKKIQLH